MVQEYLERKRAKLEKKTEISQEWVINNLKKVFERCMQEEAVTDREGNFKGVFEFEHTGATKSLELLGKHLGLFKEKVEHTGKDGAPIQHDVKATVTTELINDRIKHILGRE
jgi:phage terminase small subunit